MSGTPRLALPVYGGLDAVALSLTVDNNTNSYKHLFFRALLEEFAESGFSKRVFELNRLAIGMLAVAWYPCRVHRLSLGTQDGVKGMLATCADHPKGMPTLTEVRTELLRQNRSNGKLRVPSKVRQLLKYAPGLLQSPFFPEDSKTSDDVGEGGDEAGGGRKTREAELRRLAGTKFLSVKPLYRFLPSGTIELHPEWADYLEANIAIVSGWAEKRWITYLQERNPFAPSVATKIGPPNDRGDLTEQRKYWKRVMTAAIDAGAPMTCLYSKVVLDPEKVDLDHFLPWSYVGHDGLWNLVPVAPMANAAKRDRLPCTKEYLGGFVQRQHSALTIASRSKDDFGWKLIAADFADGLRIGTTDLTNEAMLTSAYAAVINPQIVVAKSFGFEEGWIYSI